jgi:hypothetical protein
MCPMDWGTDGDAAWWIEWRCGECGLWAETVVSNDQAARLDCALDRHASALLRAADELELERMATEADAFIAALQRDLIGAADFA